VTISKFGATSAAEKKKKEKKLAEWTGKMAAATFRQSLTFRSISF